MLEQVEEMRDELAEHLPVPTANVAVILHGSDTQLVLARPGLVVARRVASPSTRRLVAGAAGAHELHALTRRRLAERAGDVAETRALMLLTPAALYARMAAAAAAGRRLPPPPRPGTALAAMRWSWLLAGAGEWLAGQTDHIRAVLARRLGDGPQPTLPPGVRDAHVLGGTIVDLLARERGDGAALDLIRRVGHGNPVDALTEAFGGRPLRDTEDAWRAHLRRLAGR